MCRGADNAGANVKTNSHIQNGKLSLEFQPLRGLFMKLYYLVTRWQHISYGNRMICFSTHHSVLTNFVHSVFSR